MPWWPFRNRQSGPEPMQPGTEGREVIPFPLGIAALAECKRHGLRALCGVMMNRHTACRSPHPFCGEHVHRVNGDTPTQFIAHVIPQEDATSDDLLVAVYLSRAKGPEVATDEPIDPAKYAVALTYLDATPNRKLVTALANDGTYVVQYGPIANPANGDYSTGRLDQVQARTIYDCNPEPAYARYQYWESEVSEGQISIPEFHCLQLFGEWWIMDIDRERRLVQQVAALTVTDNPDHNGGVHKLGPHRGIYSMPLDSELAKVLNENGFDLTL